jgi:hypothetical protein
VSRATLGPPCPRARNRRQWATALLALFVASAATTAGAAQEHGGFAEIDHFSYFDGAGGNAANRSTRGRLHGRGSAKVHERLEFFAAGQLRGSYADRLRGRGHLNEAYAELRSSRLDLRLGRQVVAWGTTDVVNPTDYLAPRDFSEPLDTDDERLGILAARARLYALGGQLEAVVAPVLTPSRLPGPGSRWFPALPSSMPDPADPSRALDVSYRQLDAGRPAATLRNVQYALRASASLRGWDVSASYFDGWDHQPTIHHEVEHVGEGGIRIGLRPRHHGRRAVGADLATTRGPYGLRAEAAYYMPAPDAAPKYFQYVAGVERFFGDPLAAGSTLLLVQWIQQVAPSGFDPGPFDLNHVFRRALMARVQHNLTPDVQLTTDGVHDFETRGYYLRPGATWRLAEGLRAEAFMDVMGGGERAFFGSFTGNRRLQTTLRYTF